MAQRPKSDEAKYPPTEQMKNVDESRCAVQSGARSVRVPQEPDCTADTHTHPRAAAQDGPASSHGLCSLQLNSASSLVIEPSPRGQLLTRHVGHRAGCWDGAVRMRESTWRCSFMAWTTCGSSRHIGSVQRLLDFTAAKDLRSHDLYLSACPWCFFSDIRPLKPFPSLGSAPGAFVTGHSLWITSPLPYE